MIYSQVQPNPNLPGRLKPARHWRHGAADWRSAKPKSAWQIETTLAAGRAIMGAVVQPNPNLPGRLKHPAVIYSAL